MCQDESPARCYCIIPNGPRPFVLVQRIGDSCRIPSVPLPRLRLKFFPDHVPHIRRELRRDTNLEMTVLRHLHDSDDVQFCLMEAQSAVGPLPDDYLWLDGRNQGPLRWADGHSARAWQEWKSVSQAEGEPPALAPWERNGWFGDASLWMRTRLHEAGYALKGPVDQLKGAWGWSSILKAETDQGAVYFKADYDRLPKEVAVILNLAQRWPQNVPHTIAADVERNWMLLSDLGGVGLETLGPSHCLNAVLLYAKVQRSTAPDLQGWELLGCPDMTPDGLLRMTGRLLADTAVLCGGEGGLRREELTELKLKVPQIEQALIRLASSALPDTISNEDFKPGNVAVCGGEPVLYDWGSTVLSHPLFGINYFLNRMVRGDSEDGFRWRNDLEGEKRREVASAFLSQWSDCAPWEQLVSEFWLCRRLYPLYEAVKCYCDLPFVGTTSPWGAGSLAHIPHALRGLIAALDYQPTDSTIPMTKDPQE